MRITVDGRPELFDQWVGERAWYAARRHDGNALAIEGRHVRPENLEIVRAHNIEPYLAGRRALPRHKRGED